MNEGNDTGRHDDIGTDPADDERTIGNAVDDQAAFLQKNFNLSPETARVTAKDTVADRRRNPASDEVDDARADAVESNEDEAQ